MLNYSKSYYIKLFIISLHPFIFNIWWIVGPYGPRNISSSLFWEAVVWIGFGTFALIAASGIPLELYLKCKKRKIPDVIEVKLHIGGMLFLIFINFFFFFIYYSKFKAPRGTMSFFPIIDRFLNLSEIMSITIILALVVFYSSFYFRFGNVLISGSNLTFLHKLFLNAVIYLFYLFILCLFSFIGVLVCQAILHIGLMGIDLAALSMSSVVKREVGPGISRRLPYAIILIFSLVVIIALGIYISMILPYRLSSKVLDYLQIRFGSV